MEDRRTEQELVLPSLYLMYLKQSSITTTELIKLLTELMPPIGMDAAILDNRKDSHFSQKVRNLKCHNTFAKNGYATYANGRYYITKKGRQYVEKYMDSLKYLFTTDFAYSDVRDTLDKLATSKKIVFYN